MRIAALQEALTFNREVALLNAGSDYREERIALIS
jgi:hypothetical protein